MKQFERVVVIGFDAMDPTITLDLVARGRLPALSTLLDASVWAPTETPPGLVVGAIWPSITTGSWPSRHGFYCDRQLVPGSYEARHAGPRDVAVPRVWDFLSDAGRRCVVLDAPITAPSAGLDGVQLVEWGSHDRFSPLLGSPPGFERGVTARFGDYPVQPKCDDYTRAHELPRLRTDLLRGVEAKERLFTHFLRDQDWHLFFGVFGETHCAAHQFWSTHDERHPAHDAALRDQLGDVLVEVYEAIDAAVGRLLAEIPNDVPVVAIWSHGAGPHYDGDHLLSAILHRLDDAEGRNEVVASRERALRRLHRRSRLTRRALALDSARRFFKVPNNELYGGIRLNVRGREPRGRITPGPELEEVVARLREHLLELEDPDSGRPIVRDILRVSDCYDGPLVGSLPDLLVDWAREAPINGARSARLGVVRGTATGIRTGDHRAGGLVALRVPGVAAGCLRDPAPVVDIAPSVAELLGVELHAIDGKPLDLEQADPGRRVVSP